jgi:hypothetical protein
MPPTGKTREMVRARLGDAVLTVLGPNRIATYPPSRPPLARTWAEPVGSAVLEQADASPLFEDVEYRLHIVAPSPVPVTLEHRVLDTEWSHPDGRWFGTTSLRVGAVGWVMLAVADGKAGVRLRVEARKLDYETDYRLMVQDLERQIRGLTADLLSRTLGDMARADWNSDQLSHWWAIMRRVWRDLARDVAQAWHTLPPVLRADPGFVPLGQLRTVPAATLTAWARTAAPRVWAARRQWDPLTPERRYLLQLLRDVAERLEHVRRAMGETPHRELDDLLRQVDVLHRRLAASVQVEQVGGLPRVPAGPLAESHPALRRVVRWHRWLMSGLFPEAGHYFLGVRNVSQLYETWCYLTILRLVVEESGGMLRVPLRVSRSPRGVQLRSASAARVDRPGGPPLYIRYQPQFRGPTVAQVPDHVLEVRGVQALLVFDAKYRFEGNDRDWQNYGNGLPIPPVDTLNTMHQYHDAIMFWQPPWTRRTHRAVVLFPLPAAAHDRWRDHRFYQSLEAVGVGAVPLLPGGSDAYVRTLIRRFLEETGPSVPRSAPRQAGDDVL